MEVANSDAKQSVSGREELLNPQATNGPAATPPQVVRAAIDGVLYSLERGLSAALMIGLVVFMSQVAANMGVTCCSGVVEEERSDCISKDWDRGFPDSCQVGTLLLYVVGPLGVLLYELAPVLHRLYRINGTQAGGLGLVLCCFSSPCLGLHYAYKRIQRPAVDEGSPWAHKNHWGYFINALVMKPLGTCAIIYALLLSFSLEYARGTLVFLACCQVLSAGVAVVQLVFIVLNICKPQQQVQSQDKSAATEMI